MSLILSGTDGLSDVDGSAATPAIRGTDANTGIFFPAADTIGFAEGGAEVMRIDSSGQVGINRTPSAGGGPLQVGFDSSANAGVRIQTTNASTAGEIINFINSSSTSSGKVIYGASQTSVVYQTTTAGQSTGATLVLNGVAFPATQVASSDANTLDDYEEGTWTPTLQGSTTNPTVTYVTQTGSYTKIGNMVTVFVRLQTSAVSGGSGTALVAGLPFTVNSTYRNGAGIGYFSGITLGSGNTQVGLSPDTGGVSTIRFVQSGSGVGASTILVGGIGAALDIVFTFTYSV
jgi:hypothetical protein